MSTESNIEEEKRQLLEMIKVLHREYARAVEPYQRRLAALSRMEMPKYVITFDEAGQIKELGKL